MRAQAEFVFTICFLPDDFVAKYSLQSNNDDVTITVGSSFFVFVKEVKTAEYVKKYGIWVRQRFFDSREPYIIEDDATQLEENVTEFLKDKIYTCHTTITNTSLASLDLQVLLDVPQGSIPVSSHEYTKIISDMIGSYSIKSYHTNFYFPISGSFQVYPSTVSKNSKLVAKAEQLEVIVVCDKYT
jgi:hypothetical protein